MTTIDDFVESMTPVIDLLKQARKFYCKRYKNKYGKDVGVTTSINSKGEQWITIEVEYPLGQGEGNSEKFEINLVKFSDDDIEFAIHYCKQKFYRCPFKVDQYKVDNVYQAVDIILKKLNFVKKRLF